MPIKIEILKLLECAKGHDCGEYKIAECFFCKVDFNHIIEKPVQLDCGHSICESCKPDEGNILECIHDDKDANIIVQAITTSLILENYKKELFEMLLEKFKATIKLLESKKSKSFKIN